MRSFNAPRAKYA